MKDKVKWESTDHGWEARCCGRVLEVERVIGGDIEVSVDGQRLRKTYGIGGSAIDNAKALAIKLAREIEHVEHLKWEAKRANEELQAIQGED